MQVSADLSFDRVLVRMTGDRAVPFPDNNVGVGNGMTGLTRMLFVLVQFLCAKAYK